MERTLIFKTLYWNFIEDAEEHSLDLLVGGITEDGKTVQCTIQNFTPFVYLELPQRIKWNKAKCDAVFQYFQNVMKTDGPLKYVPVQKHKLHYNQSINCLQMMFPTQKATSFFARKCHDARTGLFIDGIGTFRAGEFVVHEQNVDPIIKFTATKNIQLAGWIKVKESIPEDEEELEPEDRKYSTADIDLYADWSDVEPYTFPNNKIVPTYPKYMSFDIECYSKNHNSKLPDPEVPENEIFSIASVMGNFGKTVTRSVLVTLYNPHDIPGVDIIRCTSEKELLLKWVALINSENPTFFLSYNGMKFDWNYIIQRAELLGIYPKVSQFSRIIGKRAELKKVKWESSAYGEQEFRYFDAVGRANIDVILDVERNYKLPKYSLEYVSTHFLNEHKDDVTPRQLFMLVQYTQVLTPLLEKLATANDFNPKEVIKKSTRLDLKKKVQKILIIRFCTGEVKNIRKRFLDSNTWEDMMSAVRDALTLTGKYNVQDCILPIRLADKLSLLISMEETSNTTCVPISYLHTRGQGIKVLAQIYRETLKNDFVIPYHTRVLKEDYEKYQGAIVQEAHPGYYTNVACLDFSSLYPSCMIALNICYTTLLKPDDPTPDEECNVLEFEDHVGCVHDPQHRKKKAADVLCKAHRYRFKKMTILPDGTRVNEGIMPKIERNLLANRKIVKKEMERLEAIYETKTGKATEEQIREFMVDRKWNVIEEAAKITTQEQLEVLKVCIAVLNAQQLAIKVAANSCYGILGSQGGYIPLVEGAASVTATGRILITAANAYITKNFAPVKIVYGDTDSTMVKFGDLNVAETYETAGNVSYETSHYLKTFLMKIDENTQVVDPTTGESYRIDKFDRKRLSKLDDETKVLIYTYDALPIKLEFENLYGQYFLLTKKRYVARVFNKDGKVTKETKKGVVLARRDNSQYLRDTYKKMVDAIMSEKNRNEMLYEIDDRVHKLFTRQIPDTHLIIYMGIGSITGYAKKKEFVRGKGETITLYIDEDGETFDPIGPMDPRLQYPNLPQVLLTLKMLRRGDDVPANTRLEFLYTDTPDANHQGEKAEDYTYYRENRIKENIKPDYLHYVEKQLTKPVMELLAVKFPGEVMPFEKLEELFERRVAELNELQRIRVNGCKIFEKTAPVGTSTHTIIGWPNVCKDCLNTQNGMCYNHTISGGKGKTYTFKKLQAMYNYILESMKRSSSGRPNEIDPVQYHELKNVCLLMKSRDIIDSMYARHGLKKRPMKKPPQSSEKLRVKTDARGETQVVFIQNCVCTSTTSNKVNIKRHTIGTLKAIYEEEIPTSLKKKKRYTYDVVVNNGGGIMLQKVPREYFTTFTLRGSTLMKDILIARGSYKTVVAQLDSIFSPFDVKKNVPQQFEVVEEDDE